jgi:hypothetical protein
VTATASEAATVARRVLDTHIRGAFNGLTITPDAAITIGVADPQALARAGVALHLNHHGSFVDQWCGYVDDIYVTLRLAIPFGVFPARPRPGVAA